MQPAAALSVLFVLGIILLFRSPAWRMPQLAGAPALPGAWPAVRGPEDEEEEQRPETDRAPASRRQLPWIVAAVGALRLVLLVAFGA